MCEFCGRASGGVIRLALHQNDFEFCGWSCVLAYALARMNAAENQHTTSIQTLQKKIEELESVVKRVGDQVGAE